MLFLGLNLTFSDFCICLSFINNNYRTWTIFLQVFICINPYNYHNLVWITTDYIYLSWTLLSANLDFKCDIILKCFCCIVICRCLFSFFILHQFFLEVKKMVNWKGRYDQLSIYFCFDVLQRLTSSHILISFLNWYFWVWNGYF